MMADPKTPSHNLSATNGKMDSPIKRSTPRNQCAVDQYVTGSLKSLESTSEHQSTRPLNQQSGEKPKASRRLNMTGQSLSNHLDEKKPPNWKFCDVCKLYCNSETSMIQHLAGRRHRIYILNRKWDELKENRNGVAVLCPTSHTPGAYSLSFEFTSSESATNIEFSIKNVGDSSVMFNSAEFVDLKCVTQRRYKDFKWRGKKPEKQTILPNKEIKVHVQCSKRKIGIYCTKIVFGFQNPALSIVRDIEVKIMTESMAKLMKELGPKSAYKHPPRVSVKLQTVKTIDGLPPNGIRYDDSLERTVPLGDYRIPASIRSALNHGLGETAGDLINDKSCEIKNRLKSRLSMENYCSRFSLLLHIEEAQMDVDIRKYDMSKVTLKKCRDNPTLLSLEVPGLLEKRPSVLVGDHLFLRPLKGDDTPEEIEYKAYVHVICLSEVHLGLSPKLRNVWIPNMKFNCRFVFNRLPLRLQHRAVVFASENSLDNFLFPDTSKICKYRCIQPVEADMKFYNPLVRDNPQQALAVRHIVAGSSRPAPFLIFGPPGTGKTVTIVEAMKQVLKCTSAPKILAAAPSNSAADLLAVKLLEHVSKSSILRMNAASRDWSQVHENQDFRACCNHNARGYFYPPLEKIMEYKVIVTTLVTAGRLVSANFPPGHFTHIFIDEAGQAEEPEAIIPIAGIFESAVAERDGGQVVLAGDPKQLGPILRSPIALRFGLDVSLLERYMETVDVYKRKPNADGDIGEYDSCLLVKLVCNYRSHPDILKVPNESFYQGELQVCADQLVRESLCQWPELPAKGVPLIFHGVVGKDDREERSPSFFNTAEIIVVLDYIDKLLEYRQCKINPKEIGIISPYRKQVQKFRQALKLPKYKDITIGSVEEFQGQERKVIFISTVRSRTDFLQLDYAGNLGFLKNPKRFNVAVTRAKALLVIVGNPHILCHDIHWNRLLKHCVDKGAYTGCDFDYSDSGAGGGDGGGDDGNGDLEQCLQSLLNLTLTEPNGDGVNGKEISLTTHITEPEWKSNM